MDVPTEIDKLAAHVFPIKDFNVWWAEIYKSITIGNTLLKNSIEKSIKIQKNYRKILTK